MNKTIFLIIIALISIGCGSSAPTQTNTNSTTTTASTPNKKDELTVTSHSTEKQVPPVIQSNSNSGGSPMQKSVDVTELTANVDKAEKEYKAKPTDAKTKEALATAYFERAFVLTKAAQYSAALGDFRKGLKLKPDDKEAKSMHDQIVSIYESIGREVPKEGEEKSPMPVEKK
jgi:TolA-binding protein